MTAPNTDDEARGFLLAIAAMVVWGLTPVATRFFVQTVDPLAYNIIRFGVAAVLALPLVWKAAPWRWPRADLIRLLVCSALAFPGYNIPATLAARRVPAGVIGLIVGAEPILILLFSIAIQRSGLRLSVVAGAVLAFAGVAFTSSGASVAGGSLPDVLMVVAGTVSWALYAVLAAPLVKRYGGLAIAGCIAVFGTVLLIGLTLPATHAQDWPGAIPAAGIALTGVLSVLVAFIFWNQAAERLPVGRLGLFLYLIPVVALIGGVALLGERLTPAAAAGGALILIGVALGEGRVQPLARRLFARA